MSIRCWWKHAWTYMGNRRRHCLRCKRNQTLMFYSNRTMEWVDA